MSEGERKKGESKLRRKGKSRRKEETKRVLAGQNDSRLFHNFLFYQDPCVCVCECVKETEREREQGTEKFIIIL